MNVTLKNPLPALLLLATLVLFACEAAKPGGSETETASPSPVGNKTTKEQPVRGKPSAPVQVEHSLAGTPVVGQAVEVALTFHSDSGSDVYASYEAADATALSLTEAPAERMTIPMQDNGGKATGSHAVHVTPHREGRHFLNVLVEVETEIGLLAKSVSVPVEVASVGAQLQSKQNGRDSQKDVQVDSTGEAVISLPATEKNTRD